MTPLDDEALTSALQGAAEAIDVPAEGASRVRQSARTATHGSAPTAVRSLLPRRRATRMRYATAAAVLIAIAVALPFVQTGTRRSPSTLSAHTTLGLAYPSTTIPGLPINAGLDITDQGQLKAATRDRVEGGTAFLGQYGSAAGGTNYTATGTRRYADAAGAPATVPAKVEAQGSVTLTIGHDRVQRSVAELTAMAVQLGGFVASTHVQVGAGSNTTASSGTVVLSVPEPRFAELVVRVQQVGHVTSVRTTSTDVTSQFVDLEARIAALEASRTQYLAILAKAGSISEILAVQAQVNNIQTQIEELKGARNVLDNETAYGTLKVSVGQVGQLPNGQPQAGSGVAKAWRESIRGFVLGFEWLIRIAGPTLFVLLCLLALFFAGRATWRAAQRRMI